MAYGGQEEYQVFYAAQDKYIVDVRYALGTVAAPGATLLPEGVSVPLGANEATPFQLEKRCTLKCGGASFVYAWATKTVDTSHLYILPIKSDGDTTKSYDGGTLTAATETLETYEGIGTQLVIDLSEAPDATYTYLVFAETDFSHNQANRDLSVHLRTAHRIDDPYSTGSGLKGSTRAKFETAGDIQHWSTVCKVTLSGGNKYAFSIVARFEGTKSGRLSLRKGKIMAVRIDGATISESGTTDSSSGTKSTTSVTENDANSNYLLLDNLAAGNYLIAGYMALTIGNTADAIIGKLGRYNSAGTLQTLINDCTEMVQSVNDEIAFSGIIYETVTAGDDIKLRVVTGTAATTATAKYGYLVAVQLPAGIASAFQANGSNTSTASVGTTYTDLTQTISNVTLPSNATYIEFAQGQIHADSGTIVTYGPEFAGDVASYYTTTEAPRGYNSWKPWVSGVTTRYNSTFFFFRNTRTAGSTINNFRAKVATGTKTVTIRSPRYTYLEEYSQGDPSIETSISLVVDIEAGLLLDNFGPGGASNLFQKTLPDVNVVTRVLRNGVEMTEDTTTPTVSDHYYWNLSTNTLQIKMPSGDIPSDRDQNIIVITSDFIGREQEDLIDSDGNSIPYEPRAATIPGVTSALDIRSSGVTSSTQFGTLEIRADDGAYDEKSVRYLFEGLRATVRRGYSSLTRNLSDFLITTKAVMALPSLSRESFKLRLYDKSLNLKNPLAQNTLNVFSGVDAAETTRDGQTMPVYYGTVKRVAAYRVSTEANNTRYWKICDHPLNAISKVYADGETFTEQTFTTSAALLLCGMFTTATDTAEFDQDVLYANIVGHPNSAGTALEKPGEISYHLLQNFPKDMEDVTGFVRTTVDTTSHTPANGGATLRIPPADIANYSVGNKVKVVDVSVSTKFYHGTITAISSPNLTVYPNHYVGDDVSGSYGTGSTVFTYERIIALTDADLVVDSFKNFDRRLRQRQHTNYDSTNPSVVIPDAPKLGIVISDTSSVKQALSDIMNDVFGYWYVNSIGRIGIDVPDFDRANLLENPGFEYDTVSSSYWPWSAEDGASTATITSTVKYEGAQSLEFSGGATVGYLLQSLPLEKPGDYVLTLMVAISSGSSTDVKVGVVLPGDGYGESMSDPVSLGTSTWTRLTHSFSTGAGAAGTILVKIYPTVTTGNTVALRVDNIELSYVSAIVDDSNMDPFPLDFEDENFFEARVTFDVNTQKEDIASAVIVTDPQAQGLGHIASQGKLSIPTSARIDTGISLMKDAPSALGVANAWVGFFSRFRHTMKFKMLGFTKLPKVGERLYHRLSSRVPETHDNYPLWLITKVDFQSKKNAHVVEIEAQRQVDPVFDRADISPQDIPLGAICFFSTSDTCPTGWTAVSDYGDYYMATPPAAVSPDSTVRGTYRHTHTLLHTHITTHRHAWSLNGTLQSQVDAAVTWFSPQSTPTAYGRNASAGSHQHTNADPSGGGNTDYTTATSTSSSPTTYSAGNDETFIRVKLCRRTDTPSTANPGGTGYSTGIHLGFQSSSMPSGWTRATWYDGSGNGYLLRSSTGLAAITSGSPRTISAHTITDAGASVTVSSATNLAVGQRVTIEHPSVSTTKYHAVISSVVGTTLILLPLCENPDSGDDDQPIGTSMPINSKLYRDAETSTTVSVIGKHDHDDTSGLNSHTHTAAHDHAADGSGAYGGGVSNTSTTGDVNASPGSFFLPDVLHLHIVSPTAPTQTPTSGSAGVQITSTSFPSASRYSLFWMHPTSSGVETVPAGAVILWDQAMCPAGWSRIAEADDKMIATANSGSTIAISSGGSHLHTFTALSHTLTHDHGSPINGETSRALPNSTQTLASGTAQSGNLATTLHVHIYQYTLSVPSGESSTHALNQATGLSSSSASGSSIMPPHKRLLLCRKD